MSIRVFGAPTVAAYFASTCHNGSNMLTQATHLFTRDTDAGSGSVFFIIVSDAIQDNYTQITVSIITNP
jgi:hypothetical protein